MRPPRLVAVARWTILVGGVLALALVAVMWLAAHPEGSHDRTVPSSGPSVTATEPPPAATPSTAAPPGVVPGPPVALRVPALGVRARVVPVGLDGGDVLVPPGDPRVVGWWAGGRRPGGHRGAAVLTGHTVHDGGGVFDDLAALEVGDVVEVLTRTRLLTFDVRRVRDLGKDRLAADAGRLFGRDGTPRLVLVTCSGWDGERYLGNTVVVARAR